MTNEVSAQDKKRHAKALGLDISVVLLLALITWQVLAQTLSYIFEHASVFGGGGAKFVHIDFINTYMMCKLALSNMSHQIYDAQVQFQEYNKTIAPAKVSTFCFCQYPPFYFSVFSPLTIFSLKNAYLVWNAFSLSCGAIAIFCLHRVRQLTVIDSCVLVALAVASFPSSDSVMNGEITWFFFALFTMFSCTFLAHKDKLSGVQVGILSLKPHFLLLVLVPTLLSKRKWISIAAAITILILLAMAAFTVGFENVINYPNILLHAESSNVTGNLYPERMICLRGPLSVFASRPVALGLSFGGFVVGMALTVYYFYLALLKKTLSFEWAMSLAVLLLLITSPHLHVYDAVLAFLPAALTLPSLRLSVILQTKPIAFRLWCLALFSYSIFSWVLMVVTPIIGKAVLPPQLQQMTSVNDLKCGLVGFYGYLVFHVILLALGMICAHNEHKKNLAAQAVSAN